MKLTPEKTDGIPQDVFIEVIDTWTKREADALQTFTTPEEYLEMFAEKVTSINIPTATGEWITQPSDLTVDALEDVDVRLYLFIMGALSKAVEQLFLSAMGNYKIS